MNSIIYINYLAYFGSKSRRWRFKKFITKIIFNFEIFFDYLGVGFDYRLAMAIPDYWIKLLKGNKIKILYF
jgi:hypothetical protein